MNKINSSVLNLPGIRITELTAENYIVFQHNVMSIAARES